MQATYPAFRANATHGAALAPGTLAGGGGADPDRADPTKPVDITDPALDAHALDGLYPGDAERDRIIGALELCRGNQTKAAAILGMSRRTLIYRLERYGLPRPRKPAKRGA
jgi:transcriptional regulator with GAF, ATPase, and Fis domain